jgi:chemotaxis protein MotB
MPLVAERAPRVKKMVARSMRGRRTYLDQRQSDNHDRWLVSYADFITLLFAFFVVMYALSSVSDGKYRVLSVSLVNAFGSNKAVEQIAPVAQPFPLDLASRKVNKSIAMQAKQREQMRGMAQDILKVMDSLVHDGQVRVTQSNRGISVEINASLLFASGQAQLRPESERALQQVARVLANSEQGIQVEGYTDDTPISTSQFPSNWELSAARASSVVRLFSANGVAEPRLSVIGFGANRPVTPNESAEGRARNRRVTVMILAEAPDKVVDIPLEGAPAQ